MSRIKEARWIMLVILLVFSVGMAQQALSNLTYLPVVFVDRTSTPSITPSPTSTGTPTPTATPTATPKPTGVVVLEVENPDWGDPLNEYVRIHNYDSTDVNLTGWYVRDEGPNRYSITAQDLPCTRKLCSPLFVCSFWLRLPAAL